MSPFPSPVTPARARRAGLLAVPVALTCSLVAGAFVSVAGPAAPAAAANAGIYTIGDAPTRLNQPTDPGIGVLQPTADAAANGMFGGQMDWPLIPLHAGLTRDGRIISFGTPNGGYVQDGLDFDDWNPAGGAGPGSHVTTPSVHGYDSFCAALVTLDDGRMLMASGDSYRTTMLFDPKTHEQILGPGLFYYRWYTTALRLTDDRILLLGGANPGDVGRNGTVIEPSGLAITPEIGTGTGEWAQLPGATSEPLFGNPDGRWWYPRAYNAPNGGVVGLSGDRIWALDPTGQGSVQETGSLPFNPKTSGSQVMYEPGKVLVAGGGSAGPADAVMGNADAAIVNFNGAGPTVRSVAPMGSPRTWVNLTVLPTGEVLANGGTKYGTAGDEANSVKQAEIWNPDTEQWRTAATAQRTRTYHSTSLVLPSGAVFTGGGGAADYTGSGGVYGPENNLNAELYYPSYLFTEANGAVQWASRPAITAISGSATHGGTIDLKIGDGREIASASLINVPSVTHSQNTDQRRIPLAVTQAGGTVSATLPGSLNRMPPGDYELTVLDAKGVPSAAQIISIHVNGPGQVTVSGNEADPIDQPVAPGVGGGGDVPGGAEGGAAGGGATGTPAAATTVPLSVDRSVGFESASRPGTRVRSEGTDVRVRKVGADSLTPSRNASSWIVRPGLASSKGVSFEALDRPGYYLAAKKSGAGAVRLLKNDRTGSFAGRATFLAAKSGKTTSFTLWSKRSLRLTVKGSELVVRAVDRSEGAAAKRSFLVRAALSTAPSVPLTTGRSIGIEANGKAGHRLGLTKTKAVLEKVGRGSARPVREQTSFVVRSGLSGKAGFSFESVERPGWFLATPKRGAGSVTLVKKSAKAAFAARATFAAVPAAVGKGRTFRVLAQPDLYLGAKGARIVVQPLPRMSGDGVAASFTLRSGWSPAPTR